MFIALVDKPIMTPQKTGKPDKLRDRRKGVNRGVCLNSKQQQFAVLSATMPIQQAKKVIGYHPSYTPPAPVYEEIEAQRERIRNSEGFTLQDSATFCRDIRDDGKEQTGDRLRANAQLNDILGHNAPTKTEITEHREINVSMQSLQMICAKIGATPADLKSLINTQMLTQTVDVLPDQSNTNSNINELQIGATDSISIQSQNEQRLEQVQAQPKRRARQKK